MTETYGVRARPRFCCPQVDSTGIPWWVLRTRERRATLASIAYTVQNNEHEEQTAFSTNSRHVMFRVASQSRPPLATLAFLSTSSMPPAGHSEADIVSLYDQLQKRLVQSGEWDKFVPFDLLKIQVVHARLSPLTFVTHSQCRISLLLKYKLNEDGWLDNVRGHAKGTPYLGA